MSDFDTTHAVWITSSFCNNSACVQVAQLSDGMVAIRDSKNTAKEAHIFTGDEWAAFVSGVKAGDFDLPGA